MTAGGSKTGTEPKTPSPGPPSPAVNPVGQQGPPTDAAASTPDGARRRPWAPPIDYRDNRQTTERWGQYWAPIGGQFCAPVDSRGYCRFLRWRCQRWLVMVSMTLPVAMLTVL